MVFFSCFQKNIVPTGSNKFTKEDFTFFNKLEEGGEATTYEAKSLYFGFDFIVFDYTF